MFSYSHTAPIVAPEQEEKEYADLDQEEKENILNDIYGRNAEETEEFNRREITQQQLDEFQNALDRIPLEDRTAYQLARIHCPELLQSETSPRLFLIREAFDPNKAAQRLVRYWDMRVDLFGDERAFLPISLLEGGALEGDEELLAMMRAFPNFRNFLPNDEHGRTVMNNSATNASFCRYSRNTKLKYIWYFMQLAMKRESTILRGVVILCKPDQEVAIQNFDRIFHKKRVHLVNYCFPLNIKAFHHIVKRKSFETLILPAIKFFADAQFRFRMVSHSDMIVEDLLPYGFTEEGLSKHFGGTLEPNTSWLTGEYET